MFSHEVGHTLGLRHNFAGSAVYTVNRSIRLLVYRVGIQKIPKNQSKELVWYRINDCLSLSSYRPDAPEEG
ncbi:MAG: zinc-dependent metalloprotease [Bacteroidales bacterium]